MDSKEKFVWTCCNCTFDNVHARSTCEICEKERPTNGLAEMYHIQGITYWRCVICQQENSGHCIQCQRCLATGSWVGHDRDNASTDHCDATGWRCVKCLQENSGHFMKCQWCSAARSLVSDNSVDTSTGALEDTPLIQFWTEDTEVKACAPRDLVQVVSLTDATGWRCVKCLQENSGHFMKCQWCSPARSLVSDDSVDTSTGALEDTPLIQFWTEDTEVKACAPRDLVQVVSLTDATGWRCAMCPQKNSGQCIKCQWCSAARSLVSDDRKNTSTKALKDSPLMQHWTKDTEVKACASGGLVQVVSLTDETGWRCAMCPQKNSGHCIKCQWCSAARSLVSDDRKNTSTDALDDNHLMQHWTKDTEVKACASGGLVQVVSLTDVTVPLYDSSKELRFVLLGRTGEGKSSTGNTILGKPKFQSCLSSNSVTRTCQRDTSTRYGRFIQVIDTPGMYDTEMSIQDITKEVVRCVGMTAPGPHAFILVIKLDRFTEEVQNSVKHYEEIFGNGMLKYLVVVFTRKDDLDAHGKSIEEYIQNGSKKLQEFVALCHNRFIAINNRGTRQENDEKVAGLIHMIDEMVRINKGFYTNEMFQEAEKLLREKEEKLRKENKIQLDNIREDCQRQLDAKEAEDTEIIHQFQIQLQELESRENGGTQHDVEELKKTIKNLHAQQTLEQRRIREIADTKEERARHDKWNYREETREGINNDSSFVTDTLLPGLMTLAKWALPKLVAGSFEIMKMLVLKKV